MQDLLYHHTNTDYVDLQDAKAVKHFPFGAYLDRCGEKQSNLHTEVTHFYWTHVGTIFY